MQEIVFWIALTGILFIVAVAATALWFYYAVKMAIKEAKNEKPKDEHEHGVL